MTSTVNPWPTLAGEHRSKVEVARVVRGWSRSSFRRMASGARSTNCLTLIPMRKGISVGGWTTHAAQAKSRTGAKRTATIYQLSDRLHDGRTVHLTAEEIVTTVSAWLAELGASSPLAEDLAQAVRVGDWPKAHSLGEYLGVDVTMVLCPVARRIRFHRAEIR
jgi:hypothetical protein